MKTILSLILLLATLPAQSAVWTFKVPTDGLLSNGVAWPPVAGATNALAPTFDPASGAVPLLVKITSAGNLIYYTTNGTDPTTNLAGVPSETDVFVSSTNQPLKAIAWFADGYRNPSTVTEAYYTNTVTPAPWYPSDVAGLTNWLDASALVGLSDGDGVTNWTAEVGPSPGYYGSTAVTYQTNELAGNPVLRFDNGATGRFVAEANPGAMAQPFTIATVFKYSGGTASRTLVCSTGIRVGLQNISTGNFGAYANNGADWVAIKSSDTSVHSIIVEFNGASSRYRIDGGAWATMSASPGTGGWQGIIVGGLEADAQYWDGDVAEIAVWSGQLSDGDADSWFTYTGTKWGTP